MNIKSLHNIYRINIQMQRVAKLVLTDHFDINYSEYLCLTITNSHKPTNPKTIMSSSGLTFPAITLALKTLQKEKLIKVKDSKKDLRSKDIKITKRGKDTLIQIEKELSDKTNQAFEFFDTQDHREFNSHLITILDKFQQIS